MDHPAPSPDLLVRPWRTATLVATAIAGLELVLLVVAGFLLLGRSLTPHVQAAAEQEALAVVPEAKPEPAPAPKLTPPRAVAKLSRGETSVLVLNGNGLQGAASGAAQLVRARGYRVGDVGNAPRADYARSVVLYRPGFQGEAIRFARDLNVRIVTPLDGLKQADLRGAHLALIVGRS